MTELYRMEFTIRPPLELTGNGYLGGELPASADPDEPDGRAKIANVPSRVRIVVVERSTLFPVAAALSAADGSWKVEHLNENVVFTVMGFDDRGLVNGAIQDWVVPAPMV